MVQLWDTAGQERYRAIASRFFKGVDGVLLVYDITKRDTFEKIDKWMKQAKDNANKDLPFVLIGNKSDLESERDVDTEEAKQYAEENKFEFLEVSALNNDNIDEAFNIIVKKILPQKLKTKHEKDESRISLKNTKNGKSRSW